MYQNFIKLKVMKVRILVAYAFDSYHSADEIRFLYYPISTNACISLSSSCSDPQKALRKPVTESKKGDRGERDIIFTFNMASREAGMTGMAGFRATLYNTVMRRNSIFVSTMLVSTYFLTNMFFSGTDTVWKSLNRGVSLYTRISTRSSRKKMPPACGVL